MEASNRECGRLILTRRPGQRTFVGDVIVTVVEVQGDAVRLALEAPRDVTILREILPFAPG
jgi:carbon storage regulator